MCASTTTDYEYDDDEDDDDDDDSLKGDITDHTDFAIQQLAQSTHRRLSS